MTAHPSNEELIALLQDPEHFSVERKSAGDMKDVLAAAVAFANSQPINGYGVIFVPVRDNGDIESTNLDQLQKNITKALIRAYPPLPYTTRLLHRDGRDLIGIVVYGSEVRPHFSGPAYVREGSETKKASDLQFQRLLAQRTAVGYKISEYLEKPVIVRHLHPPHKVQGFGRVNSEGVVWVTEVNQFWVTIRGEDGFPTCIPIRWIELGFETKSNQLVLEVQHTA